MSADVMVQNHGTIFLFHLLTEKARQWVESNVNVEPYMWFGDCSMACEHRLAADLAVGMMDGGLEVK